MSRVVLSAGFDYLKVDSCFGVDCCSFYYIIIYLLRGAIKITHYIRNKLQSLI